MQSGSAQRERVLHRTIGVPCLEYPLHSSRSASIILFESGCLLALGPDVVAKAQSEAYRHTQKSMAVKVSSCLL